MHVIPLDAYVLHDMGLLSRNGSSKKQEQWLVSRDKGERSQVVYVGVN